MATERESTALVIAPRDLAATRALKAIRRFIIKKPLGAAGAFIILFMVALAALAPPWPSIEL